MMQLDLFAPPSPPEAALHLDRDPVTDLLIRHGYAHNDFLLNLNRWINVTYGDLPSRLFMHPVEFVARDRQKDGKSKLWLRHPDFEGCPFLDVIERKVGVRPAWSPVDEFGRDRHIGRFWHSIDLLTDEHFQGMLDTRNFTDMPSVINGLRYHMDYGGLSTANARTVLAAYGCVEPDDRSAAFLASDQVKVTSAQQGKFVGMGTRDEQSVWAAIHGLESKRFKRDSSGFLKFSPSFLAEKEAAQ